MVGLNFDFIALNVTGFFFYSIFNIALFYVPSVQDEYFKLNPFSLIPVELNDVVFAVHAFIVSVITLIQCFCIYERANQTISKPSIALLIIFWLIAIISTIVLVFGSLNVLVYLNLLSYIKLLISFIKYIPQVSTRFCFYCFVFIILDQFKSIWIKLFDWIKIDFYSIAI